MIRPPPRLTRTYTLCPYTTLFRCHDLRTRRLVPFLLSDGLWRHLWDTCFVAPVGLDGRVGDRSDESSRRMGWSPSRSMHPSRRTEPQQHRVCIAQQEFHAGYFAELRLEDRKSTRLNSSH